MSSPVIIPSNYQTWNLFKGSLHHLHQIAFRLLLNKEHTAVVSCVHCVCVYTLLCVREQLLVRISCLFQIESKYSQLNNLALLTGVLQILILWFSLFSGQKDKSMLHHSVKYLLHSDSCNVFGNWWKWIFLHAYQ